MQKKELTVLEFAKSEGKTLDWIYKQCRLGRLPATLRDGRWTIKAQEKTEPQKALELEPDTLMPRNQHSALNQTNVRMRAPRAPRGHNPLFSQSSTRIFPANRIFAGFAVGRFYTRNLSELRLSLSVYTPVRLWRTGGLGFRELRKEKAL